MLLRWVSIAASLWGLVCADGQYRSRPDLSPPRLNITIPAPVPENGYIFVCPYSGLVKGGGLDGPEQPAGYIFCDNGDLVWSSLGLLSGWVGNMQVTEYKGEPVISVFQGELDFYHGHGWGQPTLLNQHYDPVRLLRGGNHHVISIHEFRVVNGTTALVEVYEPTVMDLRAYGGLVDQHWIVDGIFQELDLDTGQVLFEWRSLEHIDPSASVVSLASGHAGDARNSTAAWDYFHINSVDKDDNGDYLISARHASALYKVNGATGDVIWQLGGRNSTFSIPIEAQFAYQHDARFYTPHDTKDGDECVSLFDNSARANGHRGGGVEVLRNYSSAKVICLNHTTKAASLVSSLKSPDSILAPSQGNVQYLSNGNTFVGWGQAGAMTEFNRDGDPLFHAYLDSGEIGQGVQSYRAFRFNWTGTPREAPAIVALRDKAQGQTMVYVSWNGDTEAARWRFFKRGCSGGDKQCPSILLGEVERKSFEAAFKIQDNAWPWIFAQALNAKGEVLVATQAVRVTEEVDLFGLDRPMQLASDQDILCVQC